MGRWSSSADAAALAVVGGRLATGLRDVTSDLAALDSRGFWAVVVGFDGDAVCARFDHAPAPLARSTVARARRGRGRRLSRGAPPDGVVAIREAIAAGDVYQVNLCRVLSARAPADADVAALGAELAEGNPAPYAAVVRLPSIGVHVASASPERFLRRSGRVVESSPIKGTAATAAGFLAKDRAENVMIVDLVRNDLGRVCEWGSVEVPALCALEAHPGLFHLVSTVRGRLRAAMGWPEIIAATFPPGSVTGAPKLAALEVIAKLEPASRGPYCGAVGWVDADRCEGDLNVAIRTFWLAEDRLHFGTGGGITWDSTPDGEWEETELKPKARRLLQVASDLRGGGRGWGPGR